MNLLRFESWHLMGAFPNGEPDDVGSWLLHHGGRAALLEVPPGLRVADVRTALAATGSVLGLVTASHEHHDHLDVDAWEALSLAFPGASFVHPKGVRGDVLHRIGGEPLWLVKAPKHSLTDVVAVFRGVAMTGDIELGMLESVNGEVPPARKKLSMRRLADFPARRNYRVHATVSAHLNDVRCPCVWPELFTCRPCA
jgi:hypothetical protein